MSDKLKVIITVGLPASGKSTWAKELLAKEPEKWKRTNKDDLRLLLDNGKWSGKNEKFVVEIRNNIILNALVKGFNVVVDDTNLNNKHIEDIAELTKDLATIYIKDFTDVDLEVCIDRDRKRPNGVGAKVILRMWNQYLKPELMKYDESLPDAVLIDVDGTLALFGDKNPYERDFENDQLNVPVYDILDGMRKKGYQIIIASGRKDIYREVTEKWLERWVGEYDHLYMRKTAPEGQNEPNDVIVKTGIYNKYIKGKYNIFFCIDDRPKIVRLYRSFGLVVFDIGDGIDF